MNYFVLFILWGVVFLAQISIAPLFSFYGASPNLIFAFFIASVLFLKNKKFVFVSAIAAGIFAGFPSLLPAPAHIFAFSALALILFLTEKLLDDSVKKIFVLTAAFPLSFVYQISLSIFSLFFSFFGTRSPITLNFESIFNRAVPAEAFLNFSATLIFYLSILFFKRGRERFLKIFPIF